MKSDTGSQHRDPIERAHLRDPRDVSHTIYRYPPGAELLPLIGRYWFPVWSVPAGAEESHKAVMAAYVDVLRGFLPIDEEGQLINEIVRYVENNRGVLRVGQICGRFNLPERTVQRLVRRRLGLTPKWLIQRRRLHKAAERLRDSSATAAELAFLLGYADQAHFIRDFKKVISLRPGQFSELNRG
ncbi:AraC family transcriptional regulator [Arthrobacter sp.]|uniref:AraC family transcriptional regulator n=1 Tax=Arthrobacter sp. TaxID=1667 RepID=UPI0026DF254A|nr:AraC family transcriptional regulator [Arthrobacter sp.]MDO5753653.1 AraC family transcriptional regulator [Arthrobacter sp.]